MSTPKPTPVETKSNTVSEPWSAQQPHLKTIFGEAERLYNDPNSPQFFPGQTYADPSQATLSGLNMAENRAVQGSPLLGAAQGEAQKTLGGDYLNAGNPHFSQMAGRISSEVIPRVSGGFQNSGGPGGLQARAAALGLGDAIGGLAYQNYGDERNRMTGAMNAAPGLAAGDYMDSQMLGQVGAQREQIAQQPINEQIARHEFDQNAPWGSLANYLQTVQGNYGGVSNTTGTQFMQQQDPWMQALGFGMNALGTGAGIWAKSDVRAKTDIERVGSMDDGTNIYRYRYKFGGPPMFGVLAQEIAETKPDAVAVMPDGELGVAYGRL